MCIEHFDTWQEEKAYNESRDQFARRSHQNRVVVVLGGLLLPVIIFTIALLL